MGRKANKEIDSFVKRIMALTACDDLSALARKTGIPRSTLDEYAFAGRCPAPKNAMILAKISGLSLEEVLNGFTRTALAG